MRRIASYGVFGAETVSSNSRSQLVCVTDRLSPAVRGSNYKRLVNLAS